MPYSPFSSTEVTFFNKIKSEIDVMFDIGSRDDIDYLANSMDKSRSFHMFEPDPNFVVNVSDNLKLLTPLMVLITKFISIILELEHKKENLNISLTLNHLFFAQFILVR